MPLQLDINAVASKSFEQQFVRGRYRSGEHRPLACGVRWLAGRIFRRSVTRNVESSAGLIRRCSARAAPNDRPAACAPRSLVRYSRRKERDQPFRKFIELSIGKKTASLFAPQMALSQERAKVCVTGPIFHQHGQESAILHRQVRADDRSYPLLSAGDRKPLRAINTVAIEQATAGNSSSAARAASCSGKEAPRRKLKALQACNST